MQGAGAINEASLVWKPFFRTLLDQPRGDALPHGRRTR